MNKKFLVIILVALAVLAVAAIFYSSLSSTTDRNTNTDMSSVADEEYLNTSTGVGFLFKNDFAQDLKRADKIGLTILNAPYNGDIPEVIKAGFELGYTSLPVPNMAGNANDLAGLKTAYVKLVTDYAPVFVGLGNEMELMSDKDRFVVGYNEIYDAIKTECADCLVYPTFQYENFEPELTDMMKMDILALTSYPFSRYANFNSIPDSYYNQAFTIAKSKNIPVAFTEIGWTHLPEYLSGYSTAEEAQTAFSKRFKQLIAGHRVQFVSWGLLYGSPETGREWADMGMYNSDGTIKQRLFSEFVGDGDG